MPSSGAAKPDGVLLVDKPTGITSTRALAVAKRLLGARKAGHTGTLDPFATGLLPLAFGEATKFSRFLIDARKTYEATLRLGEETTTGDPEGPVSHLTTEMPASGKIDEVLAAFGGVHDQLPPMHSAIHVAGRRLYEYAREGVEVPREARRVEIFELRKLRLEGPALSISVTCSKGTYIRVLAQDIGRALGCGAYLTALRRTAVGSFSLEAAVTLEEMERCDPAWSRARLLPPEALVADLPRHLATAEESRRFLHGQTLEGARVAAGVEVALFDPAGRFLGVARCEQGNRLLPVRVISAPEAEIT